MTDDLQTIATDLNLAADHVEKTVQLLDAGNTIPFITRFRKDETGGLRASQIQAIQFAVNQQRALQERKTFVIKSIDSQGKLDDALKAKIEKACSSRELEDFYLPFKPKQQSLSVTARQQGLEPLANDVFEGDRPDVDLATRATDFVRVDRGLSSVDEVIAGVGHILSERISERADLRDELRKIIWSTGRLVVSTIDPKPESQEKTEAPEPQEKSTADSTPEVDPQAQVKEPEAEASPATDSAPPEADGSGTPPETAEPTESAAVASEPADESSDSTANSGAEETTDKDASNSAESGQEPTSQAEPATDAAAEATDSAAEGESTQSTNALPAKSDNSDAVAPLKPVAEPDASATQPGGGESQPESEAAKANEKPASEAPKKKKKKAKKKKVEHPFNDYANFDQAIQKIPQYRILAINRGERAGLLKVKIEANKDKLLAVINRSVSDEHPFAAFLQKCSKDALTRLIVPSLEREVRRELTEAAEQHAVKVFALNLRNLLLQPPVRNKRILAIDPGYKRGCTVVVLNGLGRLLESERMAVVGNQAKKDDSRRKIAEMVERHMIDVIVIGNGTACRQTEEIVSLTLENELAGKGVQYVIVNEAGASHYSTSEVGAQELPDQNPLIRSAISIGRRLINPISELVKISPANMGVGLYQHDIKSKHLAESLIEVVRDCVNLVGVDVNSAGPTLLRHVAGMNQLTARRIVEHRNEHGPFKNREELKQVSGIGDSTFVQAAGFLRVYGGDNPLDETSIHPESYELATRILNKINVTTDQLPKRRPEPVSVSKPVAVAAPAEPATETTSAETVTTDQAPAVSVDSVEGTPPADSQVADATQAVPENGTKSDTVDSEVETPATTPEAAASAEAAPETTVPAESTTGEESPSEVAAPSEAAASSEAAVESKPAVTAEMPKAPEPAKDDSGYKQWRDAISKLNVAELATEFGVGKLMMTDIVKTLRHPSHDPRQNMDAPIFRSGIIKIDDLKPEMKLTAQVVNVVDFGVFVDIGLGVSCLVHISQLSKNYVKDLHQHYVVCDRLNVWVKEVDKDKRRVQLTAIAPGGGRGGRPKRQGGGKSARGSRGPEQSSGGRGNARGGRRDRKNFRKDRRPSKPRQPAKPITDEMLSGDKPMRSFSDLAQFFDKSKDDKK